MAESFDDDCSQDFGSLQLRIAFLDDTNTCDSGFEFESLPKRESCRDSCSFTPRFVIIAINKFSP